LLLPYVIEYTASGEPFEEWAHSKDELVTKLAEITKRKNQKILLIRYFDGEVIKLFESDE
jgi:hypothetical protein